MTTNYNDWSTNQTKIKEKNDTLKSAKVLCSIRKDIIDALSKCIFPYIDGFQVEKEMDTTIMPELESEESAAEKRN